MADPRFIIERDPARNAFLLADYAYQLVREGRWHEAEQMVTLAASNAELFIASPGTSTPYSSNEVKALERIRQASVFLELAVNNYHVN